ncbi:MAG: hypothetical protein HRU11_08980 [Parvularculaceae bacterium]|nr:hypothetical protein [Parvularculaceae bacterium]
MPITEDQIDVLLTMEPEDESELIGLLTGDVNIPLEDLPEIDENDSDDLPEERLDGDDELDNTEIFFRTRSINLEITEEVDAAPVGGSPLDNITSHLIHMFDPRTIARKNRVAHLASEPATLSVFGEFVLAYGALSLVDTIVNALATSTDDLTLSIDSILDKFFDLFGGSNKCSKRRARTLKKNWKRLVKRSSQMQDAVNSGDADKIQVALNKLKEATRKFRKDALRRSKMYTKCYKALRSRSTTLREISKDAIKLNEIIANI